jgi:hypothetical protein
MTKAVPIQPLEINIQAGASDRARLAIAREVVRRETDQPGLGLGIRVDGKVVLKQRFNSMGEGD